MINEKIKAEDLETDDIIWVKEFNQPLIVMTVDFTIKGKPIIKFDNEKTLIFDKRRKFEIM